MKQKGYVRNPSWDGISTELTEIIELTEEQREWLLSLLPTEEESKERQNKIDEWAKAVVEKYPRPKTRDS